MSDSPRRPVSQLLFASRPLISALVMGLACASLIYSEAVWPRIVASAAEPEAAAPRQNEDANPTVPPNRPTEKQLKAYSGLAALAGIVIAGLGLGAVIILWAGRLRRQLRRPLPECESASRDFWFLKPPKPTVSDSSLPEWHHQPSHDQPPTGRPEE